MRSGIFSGLYFALYKPLNLVYKVFTSKTFKYLVQEIRRYYLVNVRQIMALYKVMEQLNIIQVILLISIATFLLHLYLVFCQLVYMERPRSLDGSHQIMPFICIYMTSQTFTAIFNTYKCNLFFVINYKYSQKWKVVLILAIYIQEIYSFFASFL